MLWRFPKRGHMLRYFSNLFDHNVPQTCTPTEGTVFSLLGAYFIKDSCKVFLLLKVSSFLFLLQIRLSSFLLLLQISLVLSKLQVFFLHKCKLPTSLTILHVFNTSSFSELTDISSKIWDIYERHLASQISSFLDDVVASIHKEWGRKEEEDIGEKVIIRKAKKL